MTAILITLGLKTILLTLFGLGVWALLALTRCRDARIVSFCWGLVLAVGLFGAAVPLGFRLPETVPADNAPVSQNETVNLHADSYFGPNERFARWPSRSAERFDSAADALGAETFAEKPSIKTLAERTDEQGAEGESTRGGIFTLRGLITAFGAIWLGGIAFFLAVAIAAQRRVRSDLKSALEPVGSDAAEWERIRKACAVRPESVRLLLTKKTGPALLWRFPRRATLAVPEEFWSMAAPEVREGVLRHELAHWRRGDLLRAFLTRLALLLHWFNPMAHFAARRVTEAMEGICDAAAFGTDAHGAKRFVESMLTLYETSPNYVFLQNSFARTDLTRRIERLRNASYETKESKMKKWLILSVTLAALVVALTIHAGGKAEGKNDPSSGQTAEKSAVAQTTDSADKSADKPAETPAPAAEEPFSLRGVVVDEQKKPVAGAKLYLEDVNIDESKRTTTADDKGEFSYSVNELSQWPEIWAVSSDGEKAGSFVIRRLEGETDYSPTTIIIHQARRITGRILDAEGKPVAGALVAGCDQSTVPLYVTSGEDGSFSLTYPKTRLDEFPLSLLQIFAWKEGVGFDYAVTKEIDSGIGVTPPEDISDGPFELTLQPFGKTKFRVTDEKNRPISGASVEPWLIVKPDAGGSFNAYGPPFFTTRTDADGIALCESVPDAWKEKTIYYFYGPPMKRSAEQFGKTDGYCGNYFENSCNKSLKKLTADADGVYSVQLPRQAVTRVRVTLPDGTPVPGVAISRTFHKVGGHGLWKTDSLGEVLLKENAGQFLDIAAESRLGAAPGVFAWDCGDGSEEKTLDIVLEKGIRLHGRVARADGSVPNIFYVIISEQDPNPESDADKDYCDREGCGTDTARCARQTEGGVGSLVMKSNKGLQADEYEYLLPAVKRTYKIAAVTEPDERILCIKDLTVNGDEKEITLDMVLEPKKEKPAEKSE